MAHRLGDDYARVPFSSAAASASASLTGQVGDAHTPLVATTGVTAVGPRGPTDVPALTGLGHASSGQPSQGEVVGLVPHESFGSPAVVVEAPSKPTMPIAGNPAIGSDRLRQLVLSQSYLGNLAAIAPPVPLPPAPVVGGVRLEDANNDDSD